MKKPSADSSPALLSHPICYQLPLADSARERPAHPGCRFQASSQNLSTHRIRLLRLLPRQPPQLFPRWSTMPDQELLESPPRATFTNREVPSPKLAGCRPTIASSASSPNSAAIGLISAVSKSTTASTARRFKASIATCAKPCSKNRSDSHPVQQDRSVLNFLYADYTFQTPSAAHYKIPHPRLCRTNGSVLRRQSICPWW